MKQKVLTLSVLLALLISACAPKAAPTMDPADVQHTAEAAAFTMVAQTEQAMPTNTAVPPTKAASPTLPATLTPLPTLTADASLPTVTGVATNPGLTTPLPPPSAPPLAANDANCNKALTSWKGPTSNFTIINETKPQGTIILSLYVVTELGECGYLTDVSKGPAGLYSAGAFVEGKKDFKVFGGFRITEGSWKITVRNDKIIALGSCYPGC
jgi:hypothetical protein